MRLLTLLWLATSSAAAGTLFVGAWPARLLVIDEASQKMIGEIPLSTGVPRSIIRSHDKKKLFVTSMKDSGIEVIDLATRKVTKSFKLNSGGKIVRLGGIEPDPQDKVLYATAYTVEKKIDRWVVGKPKWVVIDLEQEKITKEVDFSKEDEQSGFARFSPLRVSPDGKLLYMFRENIQIYSTDDFKPVEKIELAKSAYPGMERVFLRPGDDPFEEPGTVLGLFNSTDPVVHRSIFGIAKLDLSKRSVEFTPVAPATQGTMGLYLSPDRKHGYTVAFNGGGMNRRNEFWAFDMKTGQIARKQEFEGRTRFSFKISSDGQNLYIFGAGNTLEIYDAATMKMKKEIDVNADMTTDMVVIP